MIRIGQAENLASIEYELLQKSDQTGKRFLEEVRLMMEGLHRASIVDGAGLKEFDALPAPPKCMILNSMRRREFVALWPSNTLWSPK